MELGDGKIDLYFIPIAMSMKDGKVVVHDALADEDVRAAWLEVIADGGVFVTEAGRIRVFSTTAFNELRGRADEALPTVLAAPTSSNSLVKYGRRLLLKLFRRPNRASTRTWKSADF